MGILHLRVAAFDDAHFVLRTNRSLRTLRDEPTLSR